MQQLYEERAIDELPVDIGAYSGPLTQKEVLSVMSFTSFDGSIDEEAYSRQMDDRAIVLLESLYESLKEEQLQNNHAKDSNLHAQLEEIQDRIAEIRFHNAM